MTSADESSILQAIQDARRAAGVGFRHLILLHCADAETHRLVMPEQPDYRLQQRINTAIATTLAGQGVGVLAQCVDAARYLAWLDGAASGRDWRIGFCDPSRLVHGQAALDLFGVPATAVVPRSAKPPPPPRRGSPADQLVRAWRDDDEDATTIADSLLEAGRQGVLDMAVRKAADMFKSDEAVDTLAQWLKLEAESVALEPFGRASLRAVAILVDPDRLAECDPVAIGQGLVQSGHFDPGAQVTFLPAWFDVEAILGMTPCALRDTLRALLEGRAASALTPLEEAPETGAVALIGLEHALTPVAWEATLMPPRPEEDEDFDPTDGWVRPVSERQSAAFRHWREATLAAHPVLRDILHPTSPAELEEEIEAAVHASLLDAEEEVELGADEDDYEDEDEDEDVEDEDEDVEDEDEDVEDEDDDVDDDDGDDADDEAEWDPDEITDFIEIARAEAQRAGETVVCVPCKLVSMMQLAIYTQSGRLLDRRVFGTAEDGEVPARVQRLIRRLVPLADRPPGG